MSSNPVDNLAAARERRRQEREADDKQYMVLKVIHTDGGLITEAVPYEGTNVVFSKEEAQEVFDIETSVLKASVTLEIREVGRLVRRKTISIIEESEDDLYGE